MKWLLCYFTWILTAGRQRSQMRFILSVTSPLHSHHMLSISVLPRFFLHKTLQQHSFLKAESDKCLVLSLAENFKFLPYLDLSIFSLNLSFFKTAKEWTLSISSSFSVSEILLLPMQMYRIIIHKIFGAGISIVLDYRYFSG